MSYQKAIDLFSILCLCTACMPTPQAVLHDPHDQEVQRALEQSGQADVHRRGLWGIGVEGLFADDKAVRLGDLLTVVVSENISASRNLAMQKSKANDRSTSINGLWGYENKVGPKGFTPSTAMGVKDASQFSGKGSTSNRDSINASVTAVVTKVYGNGSMLIEGRREIIVNQQPQAISFSGVVRMNDITPRNTILSSKVARVKIRYGGGGEMATAAHGGWLSQFLDYAWPF